MSLIDPRSTRLLRIVFTLIIGALIVSGCSGSSSDDSIPADNQSLTETELANSDGEATNEIVGNDNGAPADVVTEQTNEVAIQAPPESPSPTPDESSTESIVDSPDQPTLSSTSVTFDITVPAYQSNTLQVRLQWGDKDISAQFVVDESWSLVENFPLDTENELIVIFNDDNGAITLGSFEQTFRTGTRESETFQISADQFDTDPWDTDGDGVSNFDELIAGNDPTVAGSAPSTIQPLLAVEANLELVQDKTFRISWQPSEGAQFYRVLENPDGLSGFSQISDDLVPSVQSFDHRVAIHARVNAQYLVQSCNGNGCVDSAPVVVIGTLDSAIGYFKASNTGFGDSFGSALSISADGNTLAVAAPNEGSSATTVNGDQNDESGGTGAVYIFTRNAGNWHQQAYLKASNSEAGDAFGHSLSLSADGNTAAVGTIREDSAATGVNGIEGDNLAPNSGAVYVFVRIGEVWQQQAYLKASNTDEFDRFGQDISLSADGNTLAVGADGEGSAATGVNGDQNDNSLSSAGAVYVFVRSSGLWQQQAYLKANNTENDPSGNFSQNSDGFGFSLSLSSDGKTLAVGASGEDSAATGINGDQNNNAAGNSGAVYVFVRNDGLWQQQAYLKASNTDAQDSFGFAISLSANGNTLAVGASGERSAATGIGGDQSDNTAEEAGAAYVFVRIDELWQQQAYLKASNTDARDRFGGAITLSASGNTLAVGADAEDSSANGINGDQNDNSQTLAGAVYVFVRDQGLWKQQAYVKASNARSSSPSGSVDFFGIAVSLSADGSTLAVGADSEDSAARGINGNQSDNSERNSGAVYLY